MTTRKRPTDTPGLSDLEGAANPESVPGFLPPPGVEGVFENKVRYTRTIVDPEKYYSEDLRQLAAEELDEPAALPEPEISDPLEEFLNTWQRFTGYYIRVTRLPDPATALLPGQGFNRPCREVTALGGTTFDPLNFERSIQSLAGNSGGVFRVFLVDHNGQRISGAELNRITIADPPSSYNRRGNTQRQYLGDIYDTDLPEDYRPRQLQPTPPPAPPQKSETEIWLENAQRELFQKVMMRALDPPAPPVPDPLAGLSERDRLAMGLLKEGDMLSSIVERISNLASAPEKIEHATWKDKLADAGLQLVTNNPQVVATATDIISRAAMAIVSAFAPRQQVPQIINAPMPVQHPPAQRAPVPQIQRAPAPALPTNDTIPADFDDTVSQEDAEIDMMEEVIKYLLSDKPLSLDDSVITDIRETYPDMFDLAMVTIKATNSEQVIQYLCVKSEFCADMFQSSITGPHLRKRLEELKGLLNAPQATGEPAPAPLSDMQPEPPRD